MKKNLFKLGALVAIACAAVSVTGCYSPPSPVSTQVSHENLGVFGEILVPVKDFESLGMVFTEVQFQTTVNGTINGNMFTYQTLLKEAHKIGADAIVNVTIDRLTSIEYKKEANTTTFIKEETWYGSALAIKYTGALKQENMTDGPITVSPTRQHQLDGGASASSQQPASSQHQRPGRRRRF